MASQSNLVRTYAGIDLGQGETVLLEKAANIRKAVEYAGGKMTLTNRRLVVRPHALNINSDTVDIPLVNIASVEPFNVLGLVPTGLKINLKDGSDQRLVVWGRGAVADAIRKAAGIA